MSAIVDPPVSAEALRQLVYDGEIVVLGGLPAVRRFVAYTRASLAKLFDPYDPEWVHLELGPEEVAWRLASWKPAFMHDEQSTALVREIIYDAGFDGADTHYDVPKPRTSFPVGHLTSGIAFAFPWHRDVWYAAPAQQLNWWLPVFPVRGDNCMSFDRQYFGRAVSNTSASFDYYVNNRQRLATTTQPTQQSQVRPAALGHEPEDELIVLPEVGQVMVFSGAQLHRSIPNISGRARFSVDFRTVHAPDVVRGVGAPLIDTYCNGTAIRDFRNVADNSAFDESLVRSIYGEPAADAMLVYGTTDPGEP